MGLLTSVQKRQNIWITLANITGQNSMCLSLATPGDPFCTCLIGIPEWEPTSFQGMVASQTVLNSSIMMQECNGILVGLMLAQLDACWPTKIIQSLNITI